MNDVHGRTPLSRREMLTRLAGATLFGVWGMLLAVPIAASIQMILVYFFPRLAEKPMLETDNIGVHMAEQAGEEREVVTSGLGRAAVEE